MLKIYNTATRKKEEFNKKPNNNEIVTMYNCGLTVYERPQIGNLRAYTMADILRRSLEFLGYKVKQVQNFTDVGHETFTEEQKAQIKGEIEITDTDNGIDRMEKTAKKTGLTVWEVADLNIEIAIKDFHAMNFLEPEVRPRATQEIPEQIDLIKKLLEKGFAYITSTAIYYDTSKFKDYGALSGQKQEDKKAGVREELETDAEKRNPSDFLLWHFNKPDHVMQWNFDLPAEASYITKESLKNKFAKEGSLINLRGYPGWHIECSAMAHKYLGNPVDIHTGGIDHIPVHHTNEIAQSEPIFGHPFVNFWYHNAFLSVDGKRMGKSLNNAYTLDDLKAKGFDALDLRYFYLTADFRKPQNFSWEGLEAARSARKEVIRILNSYIKSLVDSQERETDKQIMLGDIFVPTNSEVESLYDLEIVKRFRNSIEDSFDMPGALSVLWKLLRENKDSLIDSVRIVLHLFDRVLGLKLIEEIENLEAQNLMSLPDNQTKSQLENLIAEITSAKSIKDYATVDQIREQAKALGFKLEDTKDGTIWKKI